MFRLLSHDDIRLPDGAHLERVETRHAELLFAIVEAQRAELEAWDGWAVRVPTLERFAAWLVDLRLADARNEAVTCGMWSGDEPLGMVGLGEIDAWNLSATLWTFVVPSWQRRGLGKAACRSVVDYGLRVLGLERVECRCAVGNVGSRKGIEQMGFRYEGIARSRAALSGGFTDFALYGMLADDWPLARDYTLRHDVKRTQDGEWIVDGLGALRVADVGRGVFEIDRFHVEPRARSQHVGRILVEAAETHLRLAGARMLRCKVSARAPSHHVAFLQRRGFAPVADGWWARPLG